MLEFYFSHRGVLRRLRSGALGAEMDRIAGYFSSLGTAVAGGRTLPGDCAIVHWRHSTGLRPNLSAAATKVAKTLSGS
jgi:hypothetical protein